MAIADAIHIAHSTVIYVTAFCRTFDLKVNKRLRVLFLSYLRRMKDQAIKRGNVY